MKARIHPVSIYEDRIVESIATPAERARLTPVAIKGFFKLAEQWGLTDDESKALLGDLPSSTFYSWKSKPPRQNDSDRLLRNSYLLGIYKALNVLFEKRIARTWMTLPNSNPLLKGQTPVTMISKNGIVGLHEIRTLLDARRGGIA